MNDTENTNDGIETMMPNEQFVTEIHKHPFGIIFLYIQAAIGLVIAAFLAMVLLPGLLGEESWARNSIAISAALVVVLCIVVLILILATYLYRLNRLIISDRNVTQVLQKGLFNRQVSELSMANVEDVTANQKGIFATMFNYGELKIETAGEQNNFHFSYCPNPNYYGRIVLESRQKYIDQDPVAAKRANERLNVPQAG